MPVSVDPVPQRVPEECVPDECIPEATATSSAEEAEAAKIAQLRCKFLAELDSAALCEALAALGRDATQKTGYLQLAAERRERAESLRARLRSAGASLPRIQISRNMRLFAKLLRFVSGGFVIPIFTARTLREQRADSSLAMRRADSEPF